MPDWSKKFKAEYDYARGWLANGANYDEGWRQLVRRLHSLMSADGFEPGRADALSDLRKEVKRGDKRLIGHKKIGEDQGILQAVGAWSDDSHRAVESQPRCAPQP